MLKAYVASMTVQSEERDYFLSLTLRAYARCGIETEILIDRTNFDRYYEPEELNEAEFYLVSDDDVIPCKPSMFEEAFAIMRRYPQIGVLGFPIKPRLSEEEVSGYIRGKLEDRVWDFDHSGGIRLVRAGIIEKPKERPDYAAGRGGDRIFADMVRAKGYVYALAPDLFFHHLGETFSTIWQP